MKFSLALLNDEGRGVLGNHTEAECFSFLHSRFQPLLPLSSSHVYLMKCEPKTQKYSYLFPWIQNIASVRQRVDTFLV